MPNSPRKISITDFVIEAAIPIFVIGLIWSLVAFAIMLKGIFYPGQEGTLTNVFFLYVMGSVMTNRVAGLYGETDKAAMYGILLVFVMGLFALTFSGGYGAMIGGTDAGQGLWINVVIVAAVGFASYKLCRESCFDIKGRENGKSDLELRAELRAKQDWYRREVEAEKQAEPPKEKEEEEPRVEMPDRPPGIWTIYFSIFSMVVFAIGQRLLPEDNGILYLKSFHFLITNLVCALVLLLLTTLSSLRFRCWQKKALIPSGVGTFWTFAGGFAIIVVLSLASLPPRPVPEYLVKSAAEEALYEDEAAEGVKSRSTNTWGGESKKIEMRLEKEERDKAEMAKESAGQKNDTGGGTEEPKDKQQNGGSSTAGQSGGQGGSSSGKSSSRPTQAQKPPAVPPPRPPTPSMPLQGLQVIGKIVLVILLLICAMVALIKILSLIAGAGIAGRIQNALNQLAHTFRRLFVRQKKVLLPKKKLRAVLERANLLMENPFTEQNLLKTMSKVQLVRYTYSAFENYAHIHGFTPEAGQTPREFVHSLPPDFQMPEISTLLKLFLIVEYSPHTVPDDEVRQLRNIWARIES